MYQIGEHLKEMQNELGRIHNELNDLAFLAKLALFIWVLTILF